MKATYARRRRRSASRDLTTPQSGQRQPFFLGETAANAFFQPTVQRKCAACEGEEKVQRMPEKKEEEKVQRTADKKEEEKIQKKELSTTATTAPTASNYIGSINGKGQSMDKQTKSFYENRIGADFGDVKIHTGQEAAQSAKDINAHAYTYGNHVVFNEGRYQPHSSEGKHLLAHELAHVVQQGGAGLQVQRQAVPAVPAPRYRNCTPNVTGNNLSNDILDIAIARARVYVGYAIGLLQNPPEPGSVYAQALAMHFGHPITAGGRATIRQIYQRMLHMFTQSRVMCNLHTCENGRIDAFFLSSDGMIHICPPFWLHHGVCRAIILIHEGVHGAGINLAPRRRHNPNRGQNGYPGVGEPGGNNMSRAQQVSNPDAYGFFAAHVYNGHDHTENC